MKEDCHQSNFRRKRYKYKVFERLSIILALLCTIMFSDLIGKNKHHSDVINLHG